MLEPTDATLTKIQKNQILQLILQYGPPPGDFQWTEKRQNEYNSMSDWPYRVSMLTHCPTGYFCTFGAHTITTSPGLNKKVEASRHEDNWGKKENTCGKWLVIVKLEVDAPDLWATIGHEKALSTVASSPDLDNRPFTAAEQSLIFTKLAEIKGYLMESQKFAAEQAENVERQFAYLGESSRRLGRKDWLNALIGALVSQAINLAVPPEVAQALLVMAGHSFQSLWDIGQQYLR